MTLRLWPRSIAGRTFLVLLLGLFAAQVIGLTIHALDRVELQRSAAARESMLRLTGLWRAAVMAPPAARGELVRQADLPEGFTVTFSAEPATVGVAIGGRGERAERIAPWLGRLGGPPHLRPREVILSELPGGGFAASLRLPDQSWMNVTARPPRPVPWSSPTFLAALALMTGAVAALSFWAVRRLTAPIRDLAAAAERLGRDVNAPPLATEGPREVAQAAAAFNTMAERIRRFVADRTTMLAALGHDLRTPITRLRLRAEFVEDEALREKILADLAEMEAMVSATLAFAREEAAKETAAAIDLAALLRTVADEANDLAGAEVVTVAAPPALPASVRPVSLKRAVANLVQNAVAYAGSCAIRLLPPEAGAVTIIIEDEGPGIPEGEIERLMQPFQRGEPSRSRETGGAGLGLAIARSVARAHGGELVLENRSPRGLRATLTLPA
ncbi:MAG: ATP-binding protein [Acetobacteraceae bacterium]|nr:ATP-binding protein [Acetobacteraceae bacterium]